MVYLITVAITLRGLRTASGSLTGATSKSHTSHIPSNILSHIPSHISSNILSNIPSHISSHIPSQIIIKLNTASTRNNKINQVVE